jgi:hypothetical protein
MKGDIVTLYFPGDGVREGSNTATYKGIKEFKDNNNGTITFKTVKNGVITTPLAWRLKTGVELNDEADDVQPAAPAGNQGGHWNHH